MKNIHIHAKIIKNIFLIMANITAEIDRIYWTVRHFFTAFAQKRKHIYENKKKLI